MVKCILFFWSLVVLGSQNHPDVQVLSFVTWWATMAPATHGNTESAKREPVRSICITPDPHEALVLSFPSSFELGELRVKNK